MKKTNKEEFIKEEFIERHAKNGNISLILESYTDIFSDFDPRPYDQRTLSDDFLLECKKAVRRKNKTISDLNCFFSFQKSKRTSRMRKR